jgi:hypothetical protein
MFSSQSIIRRKSGRIRRAGHVAEIVEKRNVYRILVGRTGETARKTKMYVGE